jgi:hypothetical protein
MRLAESLTGWWERRRAEASWQETHSKRHQIADPLIFITPGQQVPPQLVIHAAFPPRRAL